jgi:hypothetical protein
VGVNYQYRHIECNNSGHKYETRTVQTGTNRNGISSSELGRCSGMLKSRIMMNMHYAVDYYKSVSPKVCRSFPHAALQGRDLVDGIYLRNTALKLGKQSVVVSKASCSPDCRS